MKDPKYLKTIDEATKYHERWEELHRQRDELEKVNNPDQKKIDKLTVEMENIVKESVELGWLIEFHAPYKIV